MDAPGAQRGRAQTAPEPGGRQAANHPTLLGLSHVQRSPKWSFNGRHSTSRRAEVPGPGAYDVHAPDSTSRFTTQPRFAFGLSARESLGRTKVPGPGAYFAEKPANRNGLAYSLTPRRAGKVAPTADNPGPGSHDIRSSFGEGPKYSASPRYTELKKSASPGPGEYRQDLSATIEKNPRWGFGTAMRPETAGGASLATPGPGAYVLTSAVGEGPKFTMKGRIVGPRPQLSPGPGAHGGHYSSFG